MVCIALMLFLPMCIYSDIDIVICFKEVLKDPNINLIMDSIRLQCPCSVEPKDVSRTSKIKLKLRDSLHLSVDSQ